MLRPGIVGKATDDEFSRERVFAQLDPDLPVEAVPGRSVRLLRVLCKAVSSKPLPTSGQVRSKGD